MKFIIERSFVLPFVFLVVNFFYLFLPLRDTKVLTKGHEGYKR